jgi:hypothetical protein
MQSNYADIVAQLTRIGGHKAVPRGPGDLEFGIFCHHPTESRRREERAVLTIQRVFRGWRVRVYGRVNALRYENEQRRERAVKKAWRRARKLVLVRPTCCRCTTLRECFLTRGEHSVVCCWHTQSEGEGSTFKQLKFNSQMALKAAAAMMTKEKYIEKLIDDAAKALVQGVRLCAGAVTRESLSWHRHGLLSAACSSQVHHKYDMRMSKRLRRLRNMRLGRTAELEEDVFSDSSASDTDDANGGVVETANDDGSCSRARVCLCV